uniref:Cytidylate kinase-like family protein n=1 Tax=Prevotella sp. GTC17253 TaxID=3236793 RepID=A0AB33IPG1_9BACT
MAMDKNEKLIITINREFGSGGHAIGEELASRLGVKLIDKQVLQAVADRFSLSQEEAEALEQRSPSWWDDFTHFYQSFMAMNEYHVNPRDITSRQLFFAQGKAMREIAGRESCVVVGRCGFDVFKDTPNVLKLFVHAPRDYRVRRIMERYGVDAQKAARMIDDNDYTRQLYTKTFTGHEWYDVHNYDLTLNVGKYGQSGVVDLLMRFIET